MGEPVDLWKGFYNGLGESIEGVGLGESGESGESIEGVGLGVNQSRFLSRLSITSFHQTAQYPCHLPVLPSIAQYYISLYLESIFHHPPN